MMKYLLRKAVLGSPSSIELTKEEYDELFAARTVLTNAFAIEEKYEIVVSNYLDLEKEILNAAAENMVRLTLDYSGFYGIRSALNIRVVNLLTATKLYLDQIPQHIKACLPTITSAEETIKRRCSKEYDGKFEYRFMEAFRNHVQHRGIAVHLARQGGGWTSIEGEGSLVFTTAIEVQRRYLEDDRKFKKSVLSETPDSVDLLDATRAYIGSISAINEKAREMIEDSAKAARLLIEAQHARYMELDPGKIIGLEAAEFGDQNKHGSIPLLLDWDDVRLELKRKNTVMVNLNRQYVTSEIQRKT